MRISKLVLEGRSSLLGEANTAKIRKLGPDKVEIIIGAGGDVNAAVRQIKKAPGVDGSNVEVEGQRIVASFPDSLHPDDAVKNARAILRVWGFAAKIG